MTTNQITMKPFDPTKPVQTRDGRKARIICADRKHTGPILALVHSKHIEMEEVIGYAANGRHFTNGEHSSDLINIPEKVKVKFWVNVNRGGYTVHYTRENADQFQPSIRIACVPVELEVTEGEGL